MPLGSFQSWWGLLAALALPAAWAWHSASSFARTRDEMIAWDSGTSCKGHESVRSKEGLLQVSQASRPLKGMARLSDRVLGVSRMCASIAPHLSHHGRPD